MPFVLSRIASTLTEESLLSFEGHLDGRPSWSPNYYVHNSPPENLSGPNLVHPPPPHPNPPLFLSPPHKGPPQNLSGYKFCSAHTLSSCSQRTLYGTPNPTRFSSVRCDIIIKARLFTRQNIAWLIIGPGLCNSDSLSTRTHFPSV